MEIKANKFQDYLDNANLAIKFFLECHQWSGLKREVVTKWLGNFSGSLQGKYYATRLLSQLFYYSEIDLEILLKEGVFNIVITKELLLKKQLSAGFGLNQNQLQIEFDRAMERTLFIPLLDVNEPYESGNQIARMLVQQLGVPNSQVTFAGKITSSHNVFERIIIIDDCIGSGDQCRKFWENTQIADGTLLRQWCRDQHVTAHYVALIGYEQNIIKLSKEFTDLKICCVERLEDEHSIFGQNSIFWRDEEEKNNAMSYFDQITLENEIPIFGHGDMDFSVIMHKNIPDWSLPMFWRGNQNWSILMRRKNSYV